MKRLLHIFTALTCASVAVCAFTAKAAAQDIQTPDDSAAAVQQSPATAAPVTAEQQSEATEADSEAYQPLPLPKSFFAPVVYTPYEIIDTLSFQQSKPQSDNSALKWINRENQQALFIKQIKQNYVIKHPQSVRYNESMLPEPPKEYRAVVDPQKNILVLEEINVNKDQSTGVDATVELKRKNWISSFNASLQFSQAYVSPNWYQGGNNNLNMIANLVYNIKLNQAFHPNLMFDTNIQYKLGMNNAPDDSLRNYSISEDLFQLISKFGVKAFKRWYYSVSMSFKTQLLHNYKKNTRDLSAAILSPGELNLGVGMTYNLANTKRKLTFDASLSPLSYNVKTCINPNMDVTSFGIDAGKKAVSEIGSSAELKFSWQMAYNISYTSRMFFFTDYTYAQGDWENTFNFSINKYLSAMLFVHLRYDSSTLSLPDSNWHHWQAKEILSLGFNYTFNS